MKKRLLSLLLVLTLICSTITVSAQTTETTSGKCGENAVWNYDAEAKVLTISGIGTVTLLEGFNNKEIFETLVIEGGIDIIAEKAFYKYNFKNLQISEGLKKIESYAFYNCVRLKEIVIPKTVTEIGDEAFGDINFLKKVTILGDVNANMWIFGAYGQPEVLELAGKFSGLAPVLASEEISGKPKEIVLINNNPNYVMENDLILSADRKIMYTLNDSAREKVVVPDSVEEIMPFACHYQDVEKVKFGKNLKKIGEYAFSGCRLEQVDFSKNVVTIGKGAFGINYIKKVKFNPNIKTIKRDAFKYNNIKCVRLQNFPKINRNAFDKEVIIKTYGEKKINKAKIKVLINHIEQKYKVTLDNKFKRDMQYKIIIHRGNKDIIKRVNLSKNKKKVILFKVNLKKEYSKQKVYLRIKSKGKYGKKHRIL